MPNTILIADARAEHRALLHTALADGFQLLEAASGEAALALLHQQPGAVSLLIMDLSLSGFGSAEPDGVSLLARMRQDPALAAVPVLAVADRADDAERLQALSLGAVDCLARPLQPAVLRQQIQNILRLREAAASSAAARDELTGLYTRAAFFTRAEQMVKGHPPGHFVMASFDIDNFKVINDQYGSRMGDQVLRWIATVFAAGFPPHGGVCCRVNADNFAALYPAAFADAPALAEMRRQAARVEGIAAPISFTIGRYVAGDPALPASAMYDRAMLAAASIKGRYDQQVAWYDETMRAQLLNSQRIIGEMRQALALRQFQVWFQPQYHHANGALIGAEALVRWQHPSRGLIPPGEFIPIFERNGFVYELDKFVWEETCRCLREWTQAGRKPLPVSVNISRYDVFMPDLIEVITGLTERYQVPVELLRLEITESAFARSTEQIVTVVKRLLSLGFTVEIDDFGSGYSSLNTLKDVPAQVLKLDMRFLEDNDNAQRGGNILESIVRMAKWLDMAVIAEGVETTAQADFLNSIGCVYMQGYLYAKPMPRADYEALCLRAGKEERLLALETVENLDNNAFWDPKSMDTLIFNSYVGSACIFEVHNGHTELLRANAKYLQALDSSSLTMEEALKLPWPDRLRAEDRQSIHDALQRSRETGDEFSGEYVFYDLPGCPRETYLRVTMRVIATSGDRMLVYCTNENRTAQREAEQKEREAERKERMASEQAQAIMDDAGSGITAAISRETGVEFLFSNEQYYKILGYTRRQYGEEVTDIYTLIHPEDREWIRAASREAYQKGLFTTLEYRVLRRDGAVRWVRAILSVTHFTGVAELVQLCVFSDVTAEKQVEQSLRQTDEQLLFLNETAHALLAQPDSDAAINETLARMLSYFQGNRAYIFELDHERQTADNSYEICAPGVSSEKEKLQHLPMTVMSFWLNAFRQQRYIDIPDVNALDESRSEERETLADQGIRSLVAVPLWRDGKLIGFLGIDDPRQEHQRVDRLAAIGDYLAVMLTRRDLNAKIRSDSEALLSLMNDTPGGFVRMRVNPDGSIVPVYFNSGFYKLVGMDRASLMALYGVNAMAGVHPEDLPIVREAVTRLLAGGEARSARYRLQRGGGGYLWVLFFGRCIREAGGDTYLNVYYTDATEQVRAEVQQKELLDNLPSGAALYLYDGQALEPVHLNKRYWELVARKPAEVSSLSVLDAVYPEDRDNILRALKDAIRRGCDVVCDMRIRFGGQAYRPFHVLGRVLPREDGRYAIYATYTPITGEAMSYQEMLPIALATVIGSSSDLCFVKDRELRYICCSPAFARMAGLKDAGEIAGKTDHDLFSAEYADAYLAVEKKIAATGTARLDFEELLPTREHKPHYGSTSKYPLLDGAGKVIGIYGVTRDVTEFHTAYERLELLTNSIPGGIAAYEWAEGQFRITYFNDGFCRLFDCAREEYAALSAEDPLIGIEAADRPRVQRQLESLVAQGTPVDCSYRVRLRDGSDKWINLRAAAAARHGGVFSFNAVLFDVTEQQRAMEHLRISEEENRLAIRHSGSIIGRYTVEDQTLAMLPEVAAAFSVPERIQNVPQGPVSEGLIAPESAAAYIALYEGIQRGEPSGSAVYREQGAGRGRWMQARYSTIFSDEGKPVSAVLSFTDVSEQVEREAVYNKWRQSLQDKQPDKFTLYRCNLSQSGVYQRQAGVLLSPDLTACGDFDACSAALAAACASPEDGPALLAVLRADTLLAGYYRGKRSQRLDFRAGGRSGGQRWLRLTAELAEFPNSQDVEAYLMFEDIDDRKQAELRTRRLAETDPLTGILNRGAFIARMDAALQLSAAPGKVGGGRQHGLLMLDLDGFKQVNDTFGHSTGDQTLIQAAAALGTVLRKDDLLGRLGGDEFVLFLQDIPGEQAALDIAARICRLVSRDISPSVHITGSVGIALAPRDGTDFHTLYPRADAALYRVKAAGKAHFTVYRPGDAVFLQK